MTANKFVAVKSKHAFDAIVDERKATMTIQHINQIRRAIHNEPVQLFTFLQLVLHLIVLVLKLHLTQCGFHGGDKLCRLIRLFNEVEGTTVKGMFHTTKTGVTTDYNNLATQLLTGCKIKNIVTADLRHD